MRARVYLLTAAAMAGAVVLSSSLRADDPVSSNVRFNREIIRILQRRCIACHAPGRLSMPLVNYRDVREWGRAIREEVVEQRMPPSTAAAGYGRFDNALGFTFRETTTLLSWLDGGMPRGDEKDLPAVMDPFETPPTTRADLVLEVPGQAVPPLEDLVVRRVSVATGLREPRLISRVVLRPGARSVLRGAAIYSGADDRHWVGAWLPWQHTVAAPPGRAFRLGQGATLQVVLYYRGGDEPAVDRSHLELHFADGEAADVETIRIEAAGGTGSHTLDAETTVWAIHPATDQATRTLELRATRPDGSLEVLLWEPATRFEWPEALLLQQRITLPARTVLTLLTSGTDGARRERVSLSTWTATPRRR